MTEADNVGTDRFDPSAGHPSAGGDAQIRLALPSDLDALVAIMCKQFAEHGIGLDTPVVEAAMSGLLAHPERGFVLVAARETTITGMAVVPLVWTVEHGGLSAWLDELYVEVHERGQGLGRRLVMAALSAARERGCLALDLEVEPGHERVEHIYARLGFKRSYRRRWARRLAE